MKMFFISMFFVGIATISQAQTTTKAQADEAAVRKIEELSVAAMNTQDTLFMHQYVSPDYVVMNPDQKIHGLREVI